MKRTFVAAALLGALLASAPASAAPSAFFGSGQVSSPTGCSGILLVAGLNLHGDTWQLTGAAVLNPAGGDCTAVLAVVSAGGTWNPSIGGCLTQPLGGSICVGPVPPGSSTGVTVSICTVLTGCLGGSADPVRV